MPPRFAPLALALATLLPCAGHAADADARPAAPEPARPAGPPLVISTDIGDDIDDAFALALALRSPSLNVTEQGQSLALVTRLYRLRSPDAFLQAAPDTFGDPAKEKEVLADDLVSVREVQLIPGKPYDTTEKVPRDVRYVGIVGLFRAPATNRWRYAFSTASAERSGLTLGAHACAISVQAGEPIGQPIKVVRSAAVTCP